MIKFVAQITEFSFQNILKPILFKLDAEFVHEHFVAMGKLIGNIPWVKSIMRFLLAYNKPSTTVTFDGLIFPNPVGLAAGFDYNGNLTKILPAVGFGWHTIGTVTYQPYAGNPKPRLGRLPNSQAILVNKGLKNIGARAIIRKLENNYFEIPTGISIASTNKAFSSTSDQIVDILASFRLFEASQLNHSYYELNISCPNTFGGEPFTTPYRLEVLLKALDALKITRPIYVKFPIDLSEPESLALLKVIALSSVKGVILGNLTKDKDNPDVKPMDRQTWKNNKGNLSGKPTWNRSNALISLTRLHFGKRFTIIGTGGIFSGSDAQHKLDLGADLVQLITGMIFQGPQLIGQINHYLDQPSPRKF